MSVQNECEEIAEEHAEWFVSIIMPMIKSTAKTFYVHGHKHSMAEGIKFEQDRILAIQKISEKMGRKE